MSTSGKDAPRDPFHVRIAKGRKDGTLHVLNCGAGHLKFTFGDNEIEAERASRVVQDMLNRGYALFVEGKKGLRKVNAFDAKTREYIIADGPLYPGDAEKRSKPKRGKGVPLRICANRARATGVAPTAGG